MLHLLENHDGESISKYFSSLSVTQRFVCTAETKAKVQEIFLSGRCSQKHAEKCIGDYFTKEQLILDPHTAVAVEVAAQTRRAEASNKIVICSTAHFVKFPQTVLQAIRRTGASIPPDLREQVQELEKIGSASGVHPATHESVKKCCFAAEIQSMPISASKSTIRAEILQFFKERSQRD